MADQTVYSSLGSGLRENLGDEIFDIVPADTPFMNRIGSKATSSPFHLFPTVTYTGRQDNAQVEGGTITLGAPTEETRVTNMTQIIERSVRISESRARSDHVGARDEVAKQLQRKLRQLAMDDEHAFLRGSLASGNASTARRMNGLLNIASTNATLISGVSLTEAILNNLFQLAWNVGADPRVAYVHGTLKRRISSFATSVTKFEDVMDRRAVRSVAIYESDFSVVEIELSRDMLNGANSNAIAIIDPDMFTKAWLQPSQRETLPKTRRSIDVLCWNEGTLEYGDEQATVVATGMN
jgi:hypothetical protein